MYCLPVIHVDYNTQLPLNQTFGVRTAVLTSGFHIWADWLSLMDKIWVLEKSLPHGRDKSMCDESECEMQEGIIGVYGKCFKCVCMGCEFCVPLSNRREKQEVFPVSSAPVHMVSHTKIPTHTKRPWETQIHTYAQVYKHTQTFARKSPKA